MMIQKMAELLKDSVLSRMFNFYIDKTSFPDSLQKTNIKKMTQMLKTTTDQSASYLIFLRLFKSVCMTKFMLTLKNGDTISIKVTYP